MQHFEAILNTVALAFVAGACLARVKEMGRGAHWCERIGYSVTFGGAIGAALEWWWPRIESYHSDTLFAVGCGLIAFSVVVRHIRDQIDIALGRWDGRERRRCRADSLVGERGRG